MGELRENIIRKSRVYRVKLSLSIPVFESREDLQNDIKLTIDRMSSRDTNFSTNKKML